MIISAFSLATGRHSWEDNWGIVLSGSGRLIDTFFVLMIEIKLCAVLNTGVLMVAGVHMIWSKTERRHYCIHKIFHTNHATSQNCSGRTLFPWFRDVSSQIYSRFSSCMIPCLNHCFVVSDPVLCNALIDSSASVCTTAPGSVQGLPL